MPTEPKSEEASNVTVRLATPSEITQGIYANVVNVQFGEHDFLLDFGQVIPPQDPAEIRRARETGHVTFPTKVRIVIPTTLVPGVLQALKSSLEQFARVKGVALGDVVEVSHGDDGR